MIFLKLSAAITVILVCIFCYEAAYQRYHEEYLHLTKQLRQLEKDKESALGLNADLRLRVNSQSDPAWIELTLIEVLGLCPKGHQKVVFVNDKSNESWH